MKGVLFQKYVHFFVSVKQDSDSDSGSCDSLYLQALAVYIFWGEKNKFLTRGKIFTVRI